MSAPFEMDNGFLFLAVAHSGAVVAVIAPKKCDVETVAFELAQYIEVVD